MRFRMKRPLLLLCVCLVLLGALRLWAGRSALRTGDWPDFDTEIVLEGRIIQKKQNTFLIDSITFLDSDSAVKQSIQLQCEYPSEGSDEIKLGRRVRLLGQLRAFSEATNPGQFNQKTYYESQGIAGRLCRVQYMGGSGSFSRFREGLFCLQKYLEQRVNKIFPEKEAGIMNALLLGDKEELDRDIKDLYRRNGIIHILSISGLHISFLGLLMFRLLKKLGCPNWLCALFSAGLLICYGIMTGMSVSSVRAIGMFLIQMIGLLVGRTYDLLTAWGLLGAAMIAVNPSYLMHSGFLLSYSSLLGIGTVYPQLAESGKKKKGIGAVKDAVLGGLSIALTNLPIQLLFSYEVPVWSVAINIVVIPFLSLLVICGFLAMLVPGLGFLGIIDIGILSGYEWLCRLVDSFSLRSWNPGCPALWKWILYYVFLLLEVRILYQLKRYGKLHRGDRSKRARWFRRYGKRIRLGVCTTMLCLPLLFLPFGIAGEVTFLDVGQGDGIFMRSDRGEVFLMDGGSSNQKNLADNILIPFLKYKGVRHIDGIFLSHADEDHINGILQLFELAGDEQIRIDRLFLPKRDTTGEEFETLLEAVEIYGSWHPVEIYELAAGDRISFDGGFFEIIGPTQNNSAWEQNEASLCILLQMGKKHPFRMLLSGDTEGRGEENLLEYLREHPTEVMVLKVAHHGSKYSTSRELLEQLKPQIAVISCGKRNSYKHPHEELLERLIQANSIRLRTDEKGAITFRQHWGRLYWSTFRDG